VEILLTVVEIQAYNASTKRSSNLAHFDRLIKSGGDGGDGGHSGGIFL
jgi:hypothetical protein